MSAPMTSTTMMNSPRIANSPGTTTVVRTETPTSIVIPTSGTLRLRGAPSDERRHIQWADDVIDNEGMGKKSSKVCCIYHRNTAPGESSDESSDSSSSDSDSEPDNSRARPAGGARRSIRRHRHQPARKDHDHCNSEDDDDSSAGGDEAPPKRRGRRPSPNAYERMPKYGKKKADA